MLVVSGESIKMLIDADDENHCRPFWMNIRAITFDVGGTHVDYGLSRDCTLHLSEVAFLSLPKA